MNEGAAIAWSLRVIIAVTAVVPVTAVVRPSSQMKRAGSFQTRSGRVLAGFAACPRSAHDLSGLKVRAAGGYESPMRSRRRDRHDEPGDRHDEPALT